MTSLLPGQAKSACLLELSGCSASGAPVRTHWKAFLSMHAAPGALRWELRWFLRDLGYNESDKTKLWRIIGDNWGRWQRVASACLLDTQAHMGRSRMSLAAQIVPAADAALRAAEQEYWCSTETLLAFLSCFPNVRRSRDVRDQVKTMARFFLRKTVPPELASARASFEVTVHMQGQCAELSGDDGACPCVAKCRARYITQRARLQIPQDVLYCKLLCLAEHISCAAVREYLHSCLLDIARIVDDGVESWGDSDWHKSEHAHLASEAKRRRTDWHVKQLVVRDGLHSGEFSSAGHATQSLSDVSSSTSLRWRQREVAAFRASCHLSFSSTMQLGLAVDATRLGKPSRETLIGYLTEGSKQRHAVLPPQVLVLLSKGPLTMGVFFCAAAILV